MNLSPKNIIIVVLIILLFGVAGVGYYFKFEGNNPFLNQATKTAETKKLTFTKLELASDSTTQAKGLMYRKELCDSCGMLFVFDKTENLSFWMYNTNISLDMIFIDENGKILNIAANTVPFQQSPTYDSSGLAKYVIEVPAGYSAKNSVSAGHILDITQLISQSTSYNNQYFPDQNQTN